MTIFRDARWTASLGMLVLILACEKPALPHREAAPSARTPAAGGSEHDEDWPQWGRTNSRNMVAGARAGTYSFDPGKLRPDGTVDMATTRNILWTAKLGSQTYGNPAVSNGRIFIGTNNEGCGDPRFKGDHSRLLCLDTATGKELWSLTVPKLGTGKVGDWEFLGICSQPTVVGDRVYVITNRCEVVCLDVHGLADGNQGVQDEAQYMSYVGTTPQKPVELKPTDADILWRYNMIEELGVFPHNITTGSPLVVGDIVYCNTSNGVTYDHTELPSPKAPALIALNRRIAERPGAKPSEILVGEEASGISRRILHAAWTGPSWAEVDGKGLLIYGGPDGFLYAFDPSPVKDSDGFGILTEKWRYDCVPASLRYRNGDPGRPVKYATLNDGPSEILGTPVVYKGRVYVAIGQDPEHRAGPGRFSCVDAVTGRKVWDVPMSRSLSTCAIADDLVYAADYSGWLYCLDALNGTVYWKHDVEAEIWSSPVAAGGQMYLGNTDGVLTIVDTARMKRLADELGPSLIVESDKSRLVVKKGEKVVREIPATKAGEWFKEVKFPAAINCSPIVARGVLYVATMRHLYAIPEDRP